MIITKTPFRMSFFGGGTDIESFFREYGGAVLSTTFDKYCYVNVRHLPRFFNYSTELSYSKIERVEKQPLNDDDIFRIKEFTVFQWLRTKQSFDNKHQMSLKLAEEYAKSVCLTQNINPLSVQSIIEKFANDKADSFTTAFQIMELSQELVPYVDDLRVVIISYNTKSSLISSDSPVIMINPISHPGLGNMGIVMFFPVDSHTLVLLFDDVAYSNIENGKRYIQSDNDEDVKILNTYQIIAADSIVYANTSESFSQSFLDAMDWRLKANKQELSSVLGNDIEKVVAVHERRIRYDKDLSFCIVPRAIRRIPKECRTAFPRKYDPEHDRKLQMKAEILRLVKESDCGVSKKEYKRGCKNYRRQAQIYWQRNGSYKNNS